MKKIISLLLIITFSTCLFANTNSTSPEPYTDDEFPDWANYLRRYEVITLGSLPFTTLSVTTFYGLYRYIDHDFDKNYIPNPFAFTSSAANLDKDEQKLILFSAIGVSLVAGTVDLIIHIVKKEKAKKKNAEIFKKDVIIKDKTEDSVYLDEFSQNDLNSEELIKDDSTTQQNENIQTEEKLSLQNVTEEN